MTDEIDAFRKRIRGEGSWPETMALIMRDHEEKVGVLREEMLEIRDRLAALEQQVAGLRRDLHR